MWAKKIVNQSSDFPVRRTGSYRHKKSTGNDEVRVRDCAVPSETGVVSERFSGRLANSVGHWSSRPTGRVGLGQVKSVNICSRFWLCVNHFFLLIIGLVVLATRWQASDIELRWAGWVISSRFKSLFSVAAWIVRAAVGMGIPMGMGMRTVMKPHGPVGILRRFSKMDMRLSGNALNTLNVVVAVWNASEMALSFHDQSYTARAVQFVIYFVLLAFFSL